MSCKEGTVASDYSAAHLPRDHCLERPTSRSFQGSHSQIPPPVEEKLVFVVLLLKPLRLKVVFMHP